jgi:hypothetical protein
MGFFGLFSVAVKTEPSEKKVKLTIHSPPKISRPPMELKDLVADQSEEEDIQPGRPFEPVTEFYNDSPEECIETNRLQFRNQRELLSSSPPLYHRSSRNPSPFPSSDEESRPIRTKNPKKTMAQRTLGNKQQSFNEPKGKENSGGIFQNYTALRKDIFPKKETKENTLNVIQPQDEDLSDFVVDDDIVLYSDDPVIIDEPIVIPKKTTIPPRLQKNAERISFIPQKRFHDINIFFGNHSFVISKDELKDSTNLQSIVPLIKENIMLIEMKKPTVIEYNIPLERLIDTINDVTVTITKWTKCTILQMYELLCEKQNQSSKADVIERIRDESEEVDISGICKRSV